MAKSTLPPELTLDDLELRIKEKQAQNPSVGRVVTARLRNGPRVFQLATAMEILAGDKLHHYALRIDQETYGKKKGWAHQTNRSARLEKEAVTKLHKFLTALFDGTLNSATGNLRVITESEHASFEALQQALPDLGETDKLHLVRQLLARLKSDVSVADLTAVFENSNAATLQHIAAASRYVEYRHAVQQLKALVDEPSTKESALQKHLGANPWMFGSEYSELLPRRDWTRDESLDFMLRRTADNYLEIVEIKTAAREPLFVFDSSHKCYYPSAVLSEPIGQVIHYIEEVDSDRHRIAAKDQEDPLKIRAKVVIGRDGSTEAERAALRNYNGHLYRIEVMTYDQLMRIAERVLAMFGAPTADGQNDGEPF